MNFASCNAAVRIPLRCATRDKRTALPDLGGYDVLRIFFFANPFGRARLLTSWKPYEYYECEFRRAGPLSLKLQRTGRRALPDLGAYDVLRTFLFANPFGRARISRRHRLTYEQLVVLKTAVVVICRKQGRSAPIRSHIRTKWA